MSADRIAVSPGPFFTAEEYNSNLSSGDQTTFTYEGTREEMVSQRLVERGNGAAILRLVNKGDGNYQLISTYNYDLSNGPNSGPGGSEPQSVHDLEVSVEQISALNSGKVRADLLTAFSGNEASAQQALAGVKAAIDAYNSSSDTSIAAGSTVQTRLVNAEMMIYGSVAGPFNGGQQPLFYGNPTAQTIMLRLFRAMICRGVETVSEFNSVYRRSITAATPLQVQASRTGEGMIWTSEEISAFENLPAFWWFNLPAGMQWLKYPCNVNLVAGGKTRVDYWYQAARIWSGLHFVPYGSAVLYY